MKYKKVCAFTLAIAVIFLILCSFVLISGTVPHDCTGEDCVICYRLDLFRKKADGLSAAGILHCVFTVSLCTFAVGLYLAFAEALSLTPVKLKVKLTD